MTLVTGHIAEAFPVANIHSMFKVGDLVKVDLDIDILKQMQEGHGGWNPRMAEVGRYQKQSLSFKTKCHKFVAINLTNSI